MVPRSIETRFRKELGEVTPYISIVDISAKELISNLSPNKIENISKLYGHKRLSTKHLNLEKTEQFIHLSHLAFISSRADKLCDEVRAYQKESTNDDSSPNLKELDKLRRTIYFLHNSKKSQDSTPDNKDNINYSYYTGAIELKIADYFRKLRNLEFHGGVSEKEDVPTLSEQDIIKIKEIFKHKPNKYNELTTRDVILFSQAWQNIAINLCRNLFDIDDIVKKLCKTYSNQAAARRDNAISSKLRRDYLQSDEEINRIRSTTNGWIA